MDDVERHSRPRHNWRRIHHSPLFWIGIVLAIGAMTIFVVTEDLAWPFRL
jgi:hypothetical protein